MPHSSPVSVFIMVDISEIMEGMPGIYRTIKGKYSKICLPFAEHSTVSMCVCAHEGLPWFLLHPPPAVADNQVMLNCWDCFVTTAWPRYGAQLCTLACPGPFKGRRRIVTASLTRWGLGLSGNRGSDLSSRVLFTRSRGERSPAWLPPLFAPLVAFISLLLLSLQLLGSSPCYFPLNYRLFAFVYLCLWGRHPSILCPLSHLTSL